MIVLTPNQVVEIFLLFLSGLFYLFGFVLTRPIENSRDKTAFGILVSIASLFLFFGLNAEFQWIIVK